VLKLVIWSDYRFVVFSEGRDQRHLLCTRTENYFYNTQENLKFNLNLEKTLNGNGINLTYHEKM